MRTFGSILVMRKCFLGLALVLTGDNDAAIVKINAGT